MERDSCISARVRNPPKGSGTDFGDIKRMSVCTLSVPVSSISPGRRCSAFSDAGVLGCVSINSNTDEDGVLEGKMVAEGSNKETKLPAKKKRKKGLRIKGKRRRKKLILAKSLVRIWGLGDLLQMPLLR